MTSSQLLEVAVAAAILAGGVLLYRRRAPGDDARYGSQGAVILIMIGAIVAIHGLGLLDYRPSASELQIIHGGRE